MKGVAHVIIYPSQTVLAETYLTWAQIVSLYIYACLCTYLLVYLNSE